MKKLMRAAAAALGLAGMVLAGAGLAAASESQPNSKVQVAEETGSS